jgi:hypothetical protein
MLNRLARVTAEGFGRPAPAWIGRSFDVRLSEYARFTAREAGLLIAAGEDTTTEATRERLRAGATRLGASLRRALGIRRTEDAFEALKSIYRQIGIEVECAPSAPAAAGAVAGGPPAMMTVGRCFFADYYSEPVCRVIEALDQGLVAGLFGGASLEFAERLTGGSLCCRALLRPAWAGR